VVVVVIGGRRRPILGQERRGAWCTVTWRRWDIIIILFCFYICPYFCFRLRFRL
jgi:hypothetical protein